MVTSSRRAEDVGALNVGWNEARLFFFVYVALGTNCLHYKHYSFDCCELSGCTLSFECSELISPFARLIELLVSAKTEFHCVCADAQPKRHGSVAQSFRFDTRVNNCYSFIVNSVLHFLLSCVSCSNDQKPRFYYRLQWSIHV